MYLPVLVQNIVNCTGHIIGGHNKDAKFVMESFFNPMNDLDPEKNLWTYTCLMEPVCAERLKQIEGCLSHAVMYCWIRAYLTQLF